MVVVESTQTDAKSLENTERIGHVHIKLVLLGSSKLQINPRSVKFICQLKVLFTFLRDTTLEIHFGVSLAPEVHD